MAQRITFLIFYVVGLMGIALVLFMIYLHPIVVAYPVPTGPFGVGTVTLELENALDEPEMVVRVVYPHDMKEGQTTSPLDARKLRALAQVRAQDSGLPLWLWESMLLPLKSYAQPDAPPSARKPFPVILGLPGIGGDSLYNLYLEELASYGYVLFFVEPIGDVSVAVGTKVYTLNPTFKKILSSGDRDAMYAYRQKAHERWKGMLTKVLNMLPQLNAQPNSPLAGLLDLTQIALLGHSHGGGVAIDLCATDDRCKAAISMDGWTKQANTTTGYDKPVLLLANQDGLDELYELALHMPSARYVKVPGAGHEAFSDMILLKQPLLWYLGVATTDPVTVRKAISDELISFLERVLKSKYVEYGIHRAKSEQSGRNSNRSAEVSYF